MAKAANNQEQSVEKKILSRDYDKIQLFSHAIDTASLVDTYLKPISKGKKVLDYSKSHTGDCVKLGLLEEDENGQYNVSSLGKQLMKCVNSANRCTEEDFLEIHYSILFAWHQVKETKGKVIRDIHPGWVLAKLAMEPELDYYVTNQEFIELCSSDVARFDRQYDQMKQFVIDFRNNPSKLGISEFAGAAKGTTCLGTIASKWKVLVSEDVELTDDQIDYGNTLAEGYLETVPSSPAAARNVKRWFTTVVKYSLPRGLATHIAYSLLKTPADYQFDEEIKPEGNPEDLQRQRIIFGAPGTGKSHRLKDDAKNYFCKSCVERVTFHPNYSYAQFFGTYKPVGNGGDIAYEFVEGPFLRTLAKALDHEDRNYLLIIEEINRANVASVFGDVFQLLDRDANHVSEYPVNASTDVKRWFAKNYGSYAETLSIPSNMFIWATMNSADQGVMPLDTAFKRRWSFEYTDLNDTKNVIDDSGKVIDFANLKIPFKANENENGNITWNDFRVRTNEALRKLGVNEDKCLGPFFINVDELNKIQRDVKNKFEKDPSSDAVKSFREYFINKVLMYLFEDAGKIHRKELFADGSQYLFFSKLRKDFIEKGGSIFNQTKWVKP